MNIWVEYWKKENRISLNNHAQMRENSKWVEPDQKDVFKRFCQDRQQASQFANAEYERGVRRARVEVINRRDSMRAHRVNFGRRVAGGLSY